MEFHELDDLIRHDKLMNLVRDFLEASNVPYSPDDVASLTRLIRGELDLYVLDAVRRTVGWFARQHDSAQSSGN